MGNIYNMKNQFWAGLGSRSSTVKKKFGADYEQLFRPVFLCFRGQKINLDFFIFFWKYSSVRTEKMHIIKVKKKSKRFWKVFLRGKNQGFFRTEKGYLPNLLERWRLCQIFVFRVRDFKLWLLAYFFLFNWAKFQ